jgi:hypothetical protein
MSVSWCTKCPGLHLFRWPVRAKRLELAAGHNPLFTGPSCQCLQQWDDHYSMCRMHVWRKTRIWLRELLCLLSAQSLPQQQPLSEGYEIAEKSPQNHLKVNVLWIPAKTEINTTRMSVVITLWLSLILYQTITFIMNSTDWLDSQLTSVSEGRCREVYNNEPKIYTNNYKNIYILFLFYFWRQ